MADSLTSNALGSAAAGIVSRIFTHPLDTAKARLQANYNQLDSSSTSKVPRYRGTVDVLVRTFRSEGLAGLYRGFGAILVGGTPGTVAYLCSYELFKNELTKIHSSLSSNTKVAGDSKKEGGGEFMVHFASGMLAETVVCVVYVPVDVVKERMQVQHGQSRSNYQGSWDAFKTIMRTEGFSGIYRGYAATLGSFGPYSAFYFVFYERLKKLARENIAKQEQEISSLDDIEIPFSHIVACSASAGALAAWMTSPVDMAKLRLQVQRGSLANSTAVVGGEKNHTLYTSAFDCLRKVYREQGVSALFRGSGARVIHSVPAITITMTCYEMFKNYWAKI